MFPFHLAVFGINRKVEIESPNRRFDIASPKHRYGATYFPSASRTSNGWNILAVERARWTTAISPRG